MRDWLSDVFRGRPTWMNVVLVFCVYMTFIYVPWDFLWKPTHLDEEVWFGVVFHGTAAKWLEIPHWLVYATLTYGLRQMRPWAGSLAAVYTAQIAVGMFIWNFSYLDGWFLPLLVASIGAAPFILLAMAFWSAPEFHAPRKSLRERYGDWGVITGASAGIGEEFARALARDGVNVVLCARRGERLQALAAELAERHGVSTRVIVADLSMEGGAERLASEILPLEPGILINNAGVGYSGRFDKQETERIRALVQTNCTSPAVLASVVLPGMRERGRGAIVFTGSVAGRQALPLHAAYSASKAFDNLLAEALYVENRGSGVDVLSLEPGSTATEFQAVAGEIAHAGEPVHRVVAVALEALGRQPSVISGWKNYLRAVGAARLASRPMSLYIARDVMAEQTPRELR